MSVASLCFSQLVKKAFFDKLRAVFQN